MKRGLCFVLLAVFFVSCGGGGGGGGPTAPSGTLVGNFTLQEVNGTVDGQNIRLTPPAVTGNINFTPDSRFSANISAPQLGMDFSWVGSCTVDGTTLTLYYDNGGVEVWALSPDHNQISTTATVEGTTATVIMTRDVTSNVFTNLHAPSSTVSQEPPLSFGEALLQLF